MGKKERKTNILLSALGFDPWKQVPYSEQVREFSVGTHVEELQELGRIFVETATEILHYQSRFAFRASSQSVVCLGWYHIRVHNTSLVLRGTKTTGAPQRNESRHLNDRPPKPPRRSRRSRCVAKLENSRHQHNKMNDLNNDHQKGMCCL